MFLCAICDVESEQFLPGGEDETVLHELDVVGGGRRENVFCPICYSKDRDRAVYLFLLHETDIFKKKLTILHASPSNALKAKLKQIKSAEYLETYLNNNDRNIQIDLRKIPFPSGFFDLVIANHVLEHIDNDLQALREIFRVLKTGGRAVLQVPYSLVLEKTYETDTLNRSKEFGQHDHMRIYGKDYLEKLRTVGFSVNKFNLKEKYGFEFVKKNAVIEDEIIFDILK